MPTPIFSAEPTVLTSNPDNGEGDTNSSVQNPSIAPSDSPTLIDIDPQSVAGAIEEEANPNTVDGGDSAKVAMIAVLVGAAVAVGTAFALRKWHRSRQGGLSTASDPASSSEMWSQEGQHINHNSLTPVDLA